ELELGYTATLEGWVRALDLRDQETEGHTQRVTDLTVELARRMDVAEDQLEPIRRGALLHDIGKIGIPDAILRKPGPLTEHEWTVMRRHPQMAWDMLSPIEYLRTALAIPYGHHERWNGSGYPLGTKGRQIPQAARIFAVIDVYDALRSDRPYRQGWPEERTINYIREHSGTSFDPEIVDAFLTMISER
ncbi:MAG: HD-GYP domain-containing protein, partial [Acidobacteriota bacterium]